MQVWDRTKLIEIPEVGAGAIQFVYGTVIGRLLARAILCRKFVSKLYGSWQKSRFSKKKVRKFMEQYHIDVSDCTAQEFSNFNDFFTRQRKTIDDRTAENELPAIADSKLSALPIGEDSVFYVKGVPYTAAQLLDDKRLAKEYLGGVCLIFRLSPEDYHRYSFPDAGTAEDTRVIRGVLHTVNPLAGTLAVYRRNTRHFTTLHTAHFGDMIEMEVGAMLVGKICNHADTSFTKLQEKGYFEYGGSTVILLCKKDRVKIDADILEHSARGIETKVRLGERIGVSV